MSRKKDSPRPSGRCGCGDLHLAPPHPPPHLCFWATPGGMLLSACYDGLVLYDLEFRQIAKFQTRLDHYTIRNTLSLSPTHELVALSPFPKLGATTVLATATLTEVHSFPSPSVGMLGLYKTGYTVLTYAKGMNEVEVSFYPFLGLQPILLIKREKDCWWNTFGISESELLKPCGEGGKGKVIDVNTAQNTLRIPDIESVNFVQTNGSGKRFALGFQEYSKAGTTIPPSHSRPAENMWPFFAER
jgi:hypothetical protein